MPGIEIDPASVQTNIVLVRVTKLPAAVFARTLDDAGVRVLAVGPDTIRAVTNLMVSSGEITTAVGIIESVLSRDP